MSRVVGRAAAAGAAIALAGGLAACSDDGEASEPEPNGVADMKPVAALTAAHEAMIALDGVTYEGKATFPYETGPRPVTMNMAISADGDCELIIRSKEAGVTVIRLIGKTAHIRPDRTALRVGFGAPDEATVQLLSGKWMTGPADKEMIAGCRIGDLAPDKSERKGFRAAGEGEIDGTPVRLFEGKDDGQLLTMAVATEGDPLIVSVVAKGDDGSRYRLVDTGAVDVKAPPRNAIFDVPSD